MEHDAMKQAKKQGNKREDKKMEQEINENPHKALDDFIRGYSKKVIFKGDNEEQLRGVAGDWYKKQYEISQLVGEDKPTLVVFDETTRCFRCPCGEVKNDIHIGNISEEEQRKLEENYRAEGLNNCGKNIYLGILGLEPKISTFSKGNTNHARYLHREGLSARFIDIPYETGLELVRKIRAIPEE